jgi:F-type H+-transporting ATPase subunit b
LEELGFNLPSLLVFLVNFAILLVILYFFAYKPILKMLDERSERIRESLEAAEQAKQQAAESEARTQEHLQEARREGQKLLEQARALAEKFREDEMAKAREEAEAFIARARQEIQQERDGAVEEVKRHFAVLAIQAAERVIGQSLDARAHRELIVQVLEEGQEVGRG